MSFFALAPPGVGVAPRSRQDWRLTLVLVRGNTSQTGRTPVRNYGDGA